MKAVFRHLNNKNLSLYILAQIFGLWYYAYSFFKNGFLPAPFISDKSDTFMDFFHAMYWAVHDGRYDVWDSVYPPVNFIFLSFIKYLTIPPGFYASGFSLRSVGALSIVFFIFTSIFASFYVLKTPLWSALSQRKKIVVLCIYLIGAPFLFAVERGNLITYSVIFIALAVGDMPIARVLSLAVLVNIKPYFVLLYFLYFSKRKWGEFLVSVFCTGALYVMTGVALGSDPLAIPKNLLVFSNAMPFSAGAILTGMISSVSAFSFVSGFVSEHSIGILSNNFVVFCADLAKYFNIFVIISSFAVLLLRGVNLRNSFVVAIIFCIITNMSITVGAYTLVFYFPLLPVLLERRYATALLIMVGLIFLPLDIVKYTTASTVQQISYLSGSYVQVPAEVGLGGLLRPVLNLAILALLTFEAATTRPAAPERAAAGAEGLNLGVAEQV